MADDATEFSIEYDAGPQIWVKHRASGHVYQFTISDSGEGLANSYFISPNILSHLPPADLAMRAFVSIAAVNLIEAADVLPSKSSRQLAAVRATLEAAGIEFIDGNATAQRTTLFHFHTRSRLALSLPEAG